VGLLRSPSAVVQQSAAWAIRSLAAWGPVSVAEVVHQGAIPPLVRLLEIKDQAVQHAALQTLYTLCSDVGNLELVADAGRNTDTRSGIIAVRNHGSRVFIHFAVSTIFTFPRYRFACAPAFQLLYCDTVSLGEGGGGHLLLAVLQTAKKFTSETVL